MLDKCCAKSDKNIIEPITALNNIINGWKVKVDSGKKYGMVISRLIEAEINENKRMYNKYVHDTFHAFVQNKKKLVINIAKVARNVKDESLQEVVFTKLEGTPQDSETNRRLREDTDFTNVLNPQFMQAFKQVKDIRLNLIGFDVEERLSESVEYDFSLIALLSIITSSNIQTMVLETGWDWNKTWLYSLWVSSASAEIRQRYEDEGFSIGKPDGTIRLVIKRIGRV